jgi:His Kinase A (phospho-acceptor) domain
VPLESLAPMTACGELRETGAHERHAVEHPSLLAARDRCAQAHVLCTWSDEVCRVSQRLCRTSAVRRQSRQRSRSLPTKPMLPQRALPASTSAWHASMPRRREADATGPPSPLGALLTSIAHELNQPLAAIMTNAEVGLRWLGRATPELEAVREALRDIVANSQRASAVMTRLRATLPDSPAAMPCDLNHLLREVGALVHKAGGALDAWRKPAQKQPACPHVRLHTAMREKWVKISCLNARYCRAHTPALQSIPPLTLPRSLIFWITPVLRGGEPTFDRLLGCVRPF